MLGTGAVENTGNFSWWPVMAPMTTASGDSEVEVIIVGQKHAGGGWAAGRGRTQQEKDGDR